MTRSTWCLGAAISLFGASFAPGGEPPTVSDLRAAFEAQFPKSDANGTALELERLSAALGIDLAPEGPLDPENPMKPRRVPDDGRARPEPGTENRLRFSEYIQKELGVADERIGRAAPAIERFLAEREDEIAEIESFLLANEEPRWELDPVWRPAAPRPNFLGVLRLDRMLLAHALVLGRMGRIEDAVRTMEASWRLSGALRARPELIAQLVLIAMARFQSGVLRKIDSPFYGWAERLRSPGELAGYEACFQNEVWLLSSDRAEPGPGFESYVRVRRRFVEILEKKSVCSWSESTLSEAWDEAFTEIPMTPEYGWYREVSTPNITSGLLRARRVSIDHELTALVLDARVERAALRRPRWPAKLLTLNGGVCPEARWTYRVARNGTARFALEDRIEEDSAPFRLPLEFTAGRPLVRRPARKGVVVNPAPAIGR